MRKSNKTVARLLFIVAIVFLVTSLVIGGNGLMVFGMGAGFILMAIFWIVIIWFIVVLVGSKDSGKDENPLTTAKKMYVEGEISKKQYEEMKKTLGDR